MRKCKRGKAHQKVTPLVKYPYLSVINSSKQTKFFHNGKWVIIYTYKLKKYDLNNKKSSRILFSYA